MRKADIEKKIYALMRPASALAGYDPVRSEKNLCVAILLQAIKDYAIEYRQRPKNPDDFSQITEVTEWFQADSSKPGSFFWVCSQLNINPSAIRSWLLNLASSDEKLQRNITYKLYRFYCKK